MGLEQASDLGADRRLQAAGFTPVFRASETRWQRFDVIMSQEEALRLVESEEAEA